MGFLTKEKKLTDMGKLKAAYMLNLCTVSVSQIIDYNDMNIMEQEYNAILNNLNLQEMPKDEPFLHILKEILNTITFFRIQEGDKKFIEREYQQKMKNAIWDSVPNLSVIVATGNPIAMAVSLAAQAGISYMNYRKTKARNLLEKEKQEWELQRAAIEQFNVIRRELFDTAWRIADKYDFPDNYRLTENQIKQYNEILMDSNLLRKYERLESIEDDFIAYPPFWYHYGNTANAISIEYREKDKNVHEIYRKRAVLHFEHFDKVNLPLLREDQLAASCELEYVDLLDPTADRERILKCINKARKFAGRELDVLQLCAFAYQRIGEIQESESLFRFLVNENYNRNTNAQILSRIYVARAIANSSEEEKKLYLAQYELLSERDVNPRYLFPMDVTLSETELMNKFVENQKEILIDKLDLVIDSVFNKYGIRFNKVIPQPNANKFYEDSFYAINETARKEREAVYKSELSNIKNFEEFKREYDDRDITLDWLDVLNDLLMSFEVLSAELNIAECVAKIEPVITSNSTQLQVINDNFAASKLTYLSKYSFDFFTKETRDYIKRSLKEIINAYATLVDGEEDKRMNNLSKLEGELRNLCHKENIVEPEVLFDAGTADDGYSDPRLLKVDLLGKEAKERQVEKAKETVMVEKIEEASTEIINGNYGKIEFCLKKAAQDNLSRYFANENLRNYKREAIAVLDFHNGVFQGNNDLIFTKTGIYFVRNNKIRNTRAVIPYSEIRWCNNGKDLQIGVYEYYNKYVNMQSLYNLFVTLSQ